MCRDRNQYRKERKRDEKAINFCSRIYHSTACLGRHISCIFRQQCRSRIWYLCIFCTLRCSDNKSSSISCISWQKNRIYTNQRRIVRRHPLSWWNFQKSIFCIVKGLHCNLSILAHTAGMIFCQQRDHTLCVWCERIDWLNLSIRIFVMAKKRTRKTEGERTIINKWQSYIAAP